MRAANAALLAGALVIPLCAVGCSEGPVHGRYYKGIGWIEFRSDGRVLHGELGDTAKYRVEGEDKKTIVVSSPAGETTGRIVDAKTVEFPPGDGNIEFAFAGRWAALDTTAPRPSAAEVASDLVLVVGEWVEPGATEGLAFEPDGTFRWGRGIRGTYTMLGGGRVRLTFRKDDKPAGHLDNKFSVEGDTLRLTAPDGALTTLKRLR